MKYFALARVEVGRIFRSRQAWIIMMIAILSPLCGYGFYTPVYPSTVSARLIANPTLAGGMVGAILFALLTLLELDRVRKNETEALTDAVASPVILSAARVTGVLFAGAAASLLAMIIYLPYTAVSMPNIFSFIGYVQSYILFMLCTALMGILAAAACYQIIRRVDVSFAIVILLIVLSMSGLVAENYLLRWANPVVPDMTDDFSNAQLFGMTAYSRLFWFLILGGAWTFSLLCTRRYGRGIAGSFARNLRGAGVPALSALLIFCGLLAYSAQPYVDHSPYEPTDTEYSANESVGLKNTRFDVRLDTKAGTLAGSATYNVQNKSGAPQKEYFLLNPGYAVAGVTANGEAAVFTDLQDDENNKKRIEVEIPPADDVKIKINYGGMPRIWTFLAAAMMGPLVSDDYVELRNSNLFPLMAGRQEEAGDTEGLITLPENLTVVPTGDTAELLSQNSDGTKTWRVRNELHTIGIFAGDYVMERIDGEMPVEFYYSKKHQSSMEGLGARDVMEQTIKYCTEHFGRLPFSTERPLKLVQVTAFMHGGQAFDNFSTMGETYFSDENLDDPQKGASSAEVLAHEIAHQWWGLSTQLTDMEEANWSDEGVTVYVTYRMAKEFYGEDYAKRNYVDMWQKSVDSRKANFYNRHPEYLEILPEQYAFDISSANEGAGLYDEVPLKLLKAEALVGGEEKMDEILAGLFENGGTEMPPFVTYNDFLNACGLSKEELELD